MTRVLSSVRRCAKGVHDATNFGVNHLDHAVILIDVILPIAARPLAGTGPTAPGVFVVKNCPEEAEDRPQFSMQNRICPGHRETSRESSNRAG